MRSPRRAGWPPSFRGICGLGPWPHRGERHHGGNQPWRAAIPARATARCTTWARSSGMVGSAAKILPAENRRRRIAPAIHGRDGADHGTDTTKIKTTAVRKGDRYVINGQKVWISRIQHSDLMILLARTTPLDQVKKKSEGMSIFLVDLREAVGKGLEVRPSSTWSTTRRTNCSSTILRSRREPHRRGGPGLQIHPHRAQCERVLIAAECIGDGYGSSTR